MQLFIDLCFVAGSSFCTLCLAFFSCAIMISIILVQGHWVQCGTSRMICQNPGPIRGTQLSEIELRYHVGISSTLSLLELRVIPTFMEKLCHCLWSTTSSARIQPPDLWTLLFVQLDLFRIMEYYFPFFK
jgi:hypothetical protein